MNNESIQLSLNFPTDTEAHRCTTEAQYKPALESDATYAPIVDFSSFRDQRAKAQKAEEERALMEWIRARVEHLQA